MIRNGTCDGHALRLTAREVHGEPIFICGRVETHHAEGFRHAFRNPFLRPIRVMQPQWFGNGSADPPTRIQRVEWALEHQSAATPQFAGDFALHRLAEIRNLARFSVFEPQQYSCKGGFAGSGSADHRKALPRTYVDINIVQHLTTLLFRTVVFADAATLQHCGFFVFARHNRSPYLVSASIRNDSARAEVTNCEATLVCGDCRISAVCPDSATRPSAST